MRSIGEFQDSLELVKLSSLAALILSPVTAFMFLHLISGAVFTISKMFSITPPAEGAYERVMKIVSISQAPMLLCFIPIVGPILGNLWSVWLTGRNLKGEFQLAIIGRVGIVALSVLFLFSFWNATVSKVTLAYHQKFQTSHIQNIADRESNTNSDDLI